MTIVEKPFQPSEPQEIPLSPANRMLAGLGIIVVLFLAYVYLSLSLALVLALLLLDLALVIPALRVGMAGYFATALTRQFHLARVLVRGLRLQDSPEFSVPLEREDAPRLYALLEELVGKMGVPPPAEVLLMMELNAGVRVQGYRSGRVGSKVTLGFDLFAACTEDQIRAILAHELAHAKLIQPGFNGWRINAMSRIAQVGGAVAELDESSRESKTNFYTARLIERGLRMIARAGSRLAALHSRQHEFLADALAVQVAGAATFREALLRTHLALQAMGDLDHRDRLIQSQREDSFTEWLTSRMVVKPEDQSTFMEKALAGADRDPFDQHPVLADRLRAIPEPEAPAPPSPPGTSLLADPDVVVARLLKEMERVLSEEEKKENKALLDLARKNSPKPGITGLQWLVIIGQIVFSAAFLLTVVAILVDPANVNPVVGSIFAAIFLAGIVILGLLYSRAAPKENGTLASPAYSLLSARMEQGPLCKSEREADQWRTSALAAFPANQQPGMADRKSLAEWWGSQCFAALATADYRRAYAFAHHALALNPRQFKALVTLPVVAAAIGSEEETGVGLFSLFQKYGLGHSASWSAGWALAMLNAWEPAEAYLHDAAERRPADPTVWSLLAYCQWQRGKIRESVNSMRRANYLRSDDQAQQLLLARILLDAGRPREVEQTLAGLPSAVLHSNEGLIAWTRLHLIRGRTEDAQRSADELTRMYPTGKSWIELGRAYAEAKQLDLSERAFRQARDIGYYPEGLVGLALVLHESGKKDEARRILLEAIDMRTPPAEGASRPQDVFLPVCRILVSFQDPARCTAWGAQLNVPGLGFEADTLALIVLATTNDAAAGIVQEVWQAMHGSQRPPHPIIQWQRLSKSQQPPDPMPPGIYGVQLL